jgi:acetyl-CoA carboxylase biotin carboxyl carrier protein
MAVDMKSLKEFVKLAKDAGAHELVYETKAIKLKVAFGGAQASPSVVVPQTYVAPAAAAVSPIVSKSTTHDVGPTSKPPSSSDSAHWHTILSPFVGTFYFSPAPGKPPYVKVGDKIKVGQTLCILEAMKIMNEIDSEVQGELMEICVDNESLVEYGQPLFKIKKA